MQNMAAGQADASRASHLPMAGRPPSSSYRQGAVPWDTYQRATRAGRAESMAQALGWFSIGLGLAQLLAPSRVARAAGIGDRPTLMRAVGARELAVGVGILTQRRPANLLWSRLAGDAMDLVMLASAARSPDAARGRVGIAIAAVAGIAVLDMIAGLENQQRKLHGQGATIGGEVRVEKAITVNRPAADCYRMWHDFESFPRFMKHLESVRLTGTNTMHWVAKAPAGTSVEWDAELTADETDELLAWRSLPGSQIETEGRVRFERAPGRRGTIVRVELSYRPPGGAAGALAARLFGEEPSVQMDEDLRRFKWLLETGEIPTTVGQPAGERGAWNRYVIRKGAAG